MRSVRASALAVCTASDTEGRNDMQAKPHCHKPDSLAERSAKLRARIAENRDHRLRINGASPMVVEHYVARRIAAARG